VLNGLAYALGAAIGRYVVHRRKQAENAADTQPVCNMYDYHTMSHCIYTKGHAGEHSMHHKPDDIRRCQQRESVEGRQCKLHNGHAGVHVTNK
jgi:alpha/beta superfamily hydrolase